MRRMIVYFGCEMNGDDVIFWYMEQNSGESYIPRLSNTCHVAKYTTHSCGKQLWST